MSFLRLMPQDVKRGRQNRPLAWSAQCDDPINSGSYSENGIAKPEQSCKISCKQIIVLSSRYKTA